MRVWPRASIQSRSPLFTTRRRTGETPWFGSSLFKRCGSSDGGSFLIAEVAVESAAGGVVWFTQVSRGLSMRTSESTSCPLSSESRRGFICNSWAEKRAPLAFEPLTPLIRIFQKREDRSFSNCTSIPSAEESELRIRVWLLSSLRMSLRALSTQRLNANDKPSFRKIPLESRM